MLIFRPLLEAEVDIEEIYLWYESEGEGLGIAFFGRLADAISRIKDNPRIGTIDPDTSSEIRGVLLKRFPFTVCYTVNESEIVLLAVVDQRREPGYWKDHLSDLQ
ncbi:MAG: type II toxin-antitoxin system RelE/ParE family toxin [Planctomycetota bacterium]|nr:type II toxin-antitoxin system RelE/ParE family toxin [Planctomycetota bacterium]MDA1143161.1 type II toxin-antitoxin system RelE/ParE family toxin [Planctomycetota bacterium]